MLHVVTGAELAGDRYDPGWVITLLPDAAKTPGAVGPDVDAEEVLILVDFVWRIGLHSDWEARSSRMLDIVMGGLRPAVQLEAVVLAH